MCSDNQNFVRSFCPQSRLCEAQPGQGVVIVERSKTSMVIPIKKDNSIFAGMDAETGEGLERR